MDDIYTCLTPEGTVIYAGIDHHDNGIVTIAYATKRDGIFYLESVRHFATGLRKPKPYTKIWELIEWPIGGIDQ